MLGAVCVQRTQSRASSTPHPPQYLSYDTVNGSDLGAATDDALAASGALGTAAAGGRRRLARAASSRRLLQIEKSGAELKIVVATASVRTDSEIESVTEGVDSGRMARDFTLAGERCWVCVWGGAGDSAQPLAL